MSLEQSLSHVNSLPRYIKFLTFSIACPSIFTSASSLLAFSKDFFKKDFQILCLYYIYMHSISFTFCMQFVDCLLQFLIAVFNNINVVNKSEVVHSITMNMNTYSTVFLYSWFYPLFSPGTKQMIVVTMDRLLVYYQLSSETIHSDVHWLTLPTVSHCELLLSIWSVFGPSRMTS